VLKQIYHIKSMYHMHEVDQKIPHNIIYSTTKNQNQIKIISTKLKTIPSYTANHFLLLLNHILEEIRPHASTKRVWRCQKGNQKPSIEDGQTTQWPSEKGQTLIYKTLQRKQNIEQLRTMGEFRYSGKARLCCSSYKPCEK
jgi:hypothetical protein